MNKPNTVSSKDVAREAGVSQATVSYVLNNVQGIKIKPETREAVLRAAKKLNYHPNLIARSMKLKKTMSIGVVSDKNVSNFMFMKILEGIKDALVHRNYSITLCLSKSEDIEGAEHIKYFNSNRIDGIIFVFATLTDEHVAYLVDHNIPFVQIHSNIKSDAIHLVKTDMTNAVNSAVDHLKNKGIHKIAYIGNGAGNNCDRRFSGYIKALQYTGIDVDEDIIFKFPGNDEEMDEFISNCFDKLQVMPGAVICETNQIGFHMLKYAVKRGINVPADLAVAAIGTSNFSIHSCPALSAIEAPLYEMGATGVEMVFDIMKDNVSNDIVVLDWFFVPRDSS